jgi:hypothetical protein
MTKRIVAWALVFSVLLLPVAAHAGVGDIIHLLVTITDTLKNSVGQVLGGIQRVNALRQNLQQQVAWPVTAINQAKAEAAQVRNQFTSLANQVRQIEVSSATLADPKQLEHVLRGNGQVGVGQIQPAFVKVFGAVPSAADSTPNDRNLVDVDDAMASGSLKAALLADTATDEMLHVADSLERQAASTAPGAAPFVTVQAQIANLDNQAYLQRMLAAELRAEAMRLAHANALVKRSAEANRVLRDHMLQILSR